MGGVVGDVIRAGAIGVGFRIWWRRQLSLVDAIPRGTERHEEGCGRRLAEQVRVDQVVRAALGQA